MAGKLLVLILVICCATCQSSNCFYPDGSPATDFNYTADPSATSKYKPCCDESEKDEFLPGGLCWFPSSPDHGPYPYRAACTDRSWKSLDCPSLCVLETPNRWQSLLFCPNTSTFCCQKAVDEGSCCDNPNLALVVPKLPDHVMSTLSSLNPPEPTALSASTLNFNPPATSVSVSVSDPQVTESTTFTTSYKPNLQTSPSAPTSSSDHASATSNSASFLPQATSNSHRPKFSTSDQVTIGCALGIGIPTLIVTVFMCWKQRHIPVRIEHAVRQWWDDF